MCPSQAEDCVSGKFQSLLGSIRLVSKVMSHNGLPSRECAMQQYSTGSRRVKREVREREIDVTTHQTHIYTRRTQRFPRTSKDTKRWAPRHTPTHTHTLSLSLPHTKPPLLGGLRRSEIFGTVLVAVSVWDKVKYFKAENRNVPSLYSTFCQASLNGMQM